MHPLDVIDKNLTKSMVRKRIIDYARNEHDASMMFMKRIEVEDRTFIEIAEDLVTSYSEKEVGRMISKLKAYLPTFHTDWNLLIDNLRRYDDMYEEAKNRKNKYRAYYRALMKKAEDRLSYLASGGDPYKGMV